jgi:hypothetical protein
LGTVLGGYLLAPNLIFLAGWVLPAWGLPAAALALAALADAWRRAQTRSPLLVSRQWAFVAALALVLTVIAGIGELNVQVADYLKHNLVFHDLVVYPWPVIYPHPGPAGSLLCYYIAYYLPASLIGKLFGMVWTAPASFAWGFTGVLLAFAWIVRLGRPRGGAVLVSFMLVDGFAWLPGLYTLAQRLGRVAGGTGGDWWTSDALTERFASFGTPPMRLLLESEPAHLLWVPQHAIAAWLATACALRSLEEGEPPRYMGLVLAATLLWSPFVAIGLAPFVLLALVRHPRAAAAWPGLAGGLALALPAGLYFLAHSTYEHLGFLFSELSGPQDWMRYVFFLLASVGVFVVAVALVRQRFDAPQEAEWRLFLVAAAWLVATTLVTMGHFNDWVMRVSMPALVVFRLVVARLVVEVWRRGGRLAPRLALAALVLASAERPIKLLVLTPFGKVGGQPVPTTIATATREAPTLGDLPGSARWRFGRQYLGSPESWSVRHILKQRGRAADPASPR